MAILDDGIGVDWNGSPTQVQPKTKKLPSWITDYLEKKAAPAPLPNLTAGTRSMAHGYTPNWMQQYLPTRPVKAAPSPRTREGRMGGPTPSSVQGTAPMYGPGQSPGLNERAARTGRGGQPTTPITGVPTWMQNAANWLNEQTGGQPLLPTTTGGANIPYFPAGGETPTGEIAGEYGSSPYNWPIETPEQRLASLMERTSGVPIGPSGGEVPAWMHNMADWLNEQTGGQPLIATATGGANIPYFPAGGETPTGEMAGEYGSSPYNWPITQPEEPTAPAGAEENTIAEEKLGLRKRTELHAIQRAYRKRLEDMINSLDYNQGGEEGYWSAPSGGYWDGYGGGNGGGGYSPEDVSSFWLNLARWNI